MGPFHRFAEKTPTSLLRKWGFEINPYHPLGLRVSKGKRPFDFAPFGLSSWPKAGQAARHPARRTAGKKMAGSPR
jgi:hypothetical protein